MAITPKDLPPRVPRNSSPAFGIGPPCVVVGEVAVHVGPIEVVGTLAQCGKCGQGFAIKPFAP